MATQQHPKSVSKTASKSEPAAVKPVKKPAVSGLKPGKTMPKFAAAALAATAAPVKSPPKPVKAAAPEPEKPVPAKPASAKTVEKKFAEVVEPLAAAPSLGSEVVASPAIPTHGYQQLTQFGSANVTALVEANSVFLNGFQEVTKVMLAQTQATLQHAATTATAILSAKTMKDMVDLNAAFAKGNYEKLLQDTSKLGELMVKLATETAAPLATRATHMVEESIRKRV